MTVYEGDCNTVLLDKVFPTCRFEDYRRGLCLLDPYDIDLDWKVVRTAGHMRSIEILLNFMIMDMNRNILHRNPVNVEPQQQERMTRFWGDESWREVCYQEQRGFFGDVEEKRTNRAVAAGYKDRLKNLAGFDYVTDPLPLRNSTGAVIYYLLFASNNETGYRIANHVFRRYEREGLSDGL